MLFQLCWCAVCFDRSVSTITYRVSRWTTSGGTSVSTVDKMSTALRNGGIPQAVTDPITKMFVEWTKADIELVCNEPHSSIILCLKCGSVRSLLRLKQMVLSGYLLRLLSDAIEQFIQSRPRIQLVIQAEDYNSCLSYLSNIARKFVCIVFGYFVASGHRLL